tara:strand:+ start:327 stop:683 length:357 start_codon:yes stop_codon:yes gene_type:complete
MSKSQVSLYAIIIIIFLNLTTNLAKANYEDWIFLRCVKSSDNIKYFEVFASREMMIEWNGYQFTFTRLALFLTQTELNELAKISLHRHLGAMAYTVLNFDGSSQSNKVLQCDSVPRLL